jgi:conjugal transfer pilus assembly protein TraK
VKKIILVLCMGFLSPANFAVYGADMAGSAVRQISLAADVKEDAGSENDSHNIELKKGKIGFPDAPGRHDLQKHSKEAPEGSKLEPGVVLDVPVTVLPEISTTVRMSSSDLNRIVCPVDIKEALTSDEKGVTITTTGKDAFVKFKIIKRSDGARSYTTTPTEIFVVCGDNTYSIVALPARVPTQTIKLSTGLEHRIKDNTSIYSGLPYERKIQRAIKDVYTGEMPDSYLVKQIDQTDTSFHGILVALRKEVDIEGEGIKVKEYNVSLKPGQNKAIRLNEKQFLKKEFTINPVAVSIDKLTLRPGDVSRVFIVEQRPEQSLKGVNFQLLSLDDGPRPSVQAGKEPHDKNKPLAPGAGGTYSNSLVQQKNRVGGKSE